MMVQLNKGNIVKYLTAILLLVVALNANATGHNPQTVTPEESPTLLAPEECRKLSKQINLLSKIVVESDQKTWAMRKKMDKIRDQGIFIQFQNHEPLNPAVLVQYTNAWQVISVQHSEFQTQRNVAYDTRETKFEELEAGCNYRPDGES